MGVLGDSQVGHYFFLCAYSNGCFPGKKLTFKLSNDRPLLKADGFSLGVAPGMSVFEKDGVSAWSTI